MDVTLFSTKLENYICSFFRSHEYVNDIPPVADAALFLASCAIKISWRASPIVQKSELKTIQPVIQFSDCLMAVMAMTSL